MTSRKTRATARATANTGILRSAQDDDEKRATARERGEDRAGAGVVGRGLKETTVKRGAPSGWRVENGGCEVGAMGLRRKALFLDRDGVINQEVGYLHAAEDVRWVDGIFELCRVAVGLGYKLVVVTNQSGIARGLYSEEQFETLMVWMREEFVKNGVGLDAVYFCPFHPEHGVGKYKKEHDDRKPGTGMLRRAAKELGVELGASVMVGDRCTDVAAANAAGLRTAFLLEGTETGCKGEYKSVKTFHQVQEWLVVAAAASADEVAKGEGDLDGALE
jgi:D-glycero-D-manno-heptose 1,7-bisphosphate phosphatase